MLLPVFRKVLWFTAIGWLTILLIGPVMAVVGTLLPFALVGALVWLAGWGALRAAERFRLTAVRDKLAGNRVLPAVGRGIRVVVGQGVHQCKNAMPAVREGAWRAGRGAGRMFQEGIHHCREAAPAVRERAWLVGCGAGRAIRGGLHQCGEVVPDLKAKGRRIAEKTATFLRAATRIGVEMVCGSVVGGLVAWYAVGQSEEAIAAGALIGAALGFVVGGPAREPVRETVNG
jgi:hypothetical protein